MSDTTKPPPLFRAEDCSIHVGGSVGEHYIELQHANARIAPLVAALEAFVNSETDEEDVTTTRRLLAAYEALKGKP